MKIRKAVLPAAGRGTRFLPATKSQPKEMLPVVDKPCIQYIIEEAVASGITEIIIVTSKDKRSIEDHFDNSFELKHHLHKGGKHKQIAELENIEKLAKFIYVRQDKPLGDGHAILCAKELVKDEPFAVLFGDDFYDSEVPALAQMIAQYEKLNTPIIGAHKVPQSQCHKYGIMDGEMIDGAIKISRFVEKPTADQAPPSNLAFIGKCIVTPELLNTLENTERNCNDELKLADAMIKYIETNPIHGVPIEGTRFDTGDKLGYLKAVVHFALKHPELKDDFKQHLQDLGL